MKTRRVNDSPSAIFKWPGLSTHLNQNGKLKIIMGISKTLVNPAFAGSKLTY